MKADDPASNGILVYSLKGQLVYSNRAGREVLDAFQSGTDLSPPRNRENGLEIKRLCTRVRELMTASQKRPGVERASLCWEVPLEIGDRLYRLRGLGIESCMREEPRIVVLVEMQHRPTGSLDLGAIHEQYKLTNREGQILDLLAKGRSYKEIAYELSISANTVRDHIKNIRFKIHADSKCGILARLLEAKAGVEGSALSTDLDSTSYKDLNRHRIKQKANGFHPDVKVPFSTRLVKKKSNENRAVTADISVGHDRIMTLPSGMGKVRRFNVP